MVTLTRLDVRNFRMLQANSVALGRFHVLVGPNASGKTTLLDALQFVADVLRDGVAAAVRARTPSFLELCFDPTRPISFAVEMTLSGTGGRPRRLRYELQVGLADGDGLRVELENLFILPERAPDASGSAEQLSLFGERALEQPLIHRSAPKGWRKVVGKTAEGNDYFRDERTAWNNIFKFGTGRAALGSIPEDVERFPLSIAARNTLRDGVRTLALDAREMRASSPPGTASRMALDGSNLPFVARDLHRRDPFLFEQWTEHVGTAVQGLTQIEIHERPEDRHLVLRAHFEGMHGEPVPSWLLSDGTLRLMALTLLSYATPHQKNEIYLIEEPENGLHPLAIQAAHEALADPVKGTQILCATHSPVFLAQVSLDEVIVFKRTVEGCSLVRHGVEVPELSSRQGKRNVADLLVTGVLS